MDKKVSTTREDLMSVINLLERENIVYWFDGRWSVDVLAGKQTRIHRDIDIDFDALQTDKLLGILARKVMNLIPIKDLSGKKINELCRCRILHKIHLLQYAKGKL